MAGFKMNGKFMAAPVNLAPPVTKQFCVSSSGLDPATTARTAKRNGYDMNVALFKAACIYTDCEYT
jgi:hypothetical protein